MNAAHFGTIKAGCLLVLLGALGTWQLQADVRIHGLIASLPHPELQEAIDQSTSSDDVILIRGSTHDVTDGMVISKPLTLRAWRGNVSIK